MYPSGRRNWNLTPVFVGSNPTIPAILFLKGDIKMYENPFLNNHTVFVKDSESVFFYDDTKKTEEYLKEIKAEHPEARIYGSVKFGDFRYRVVY